MTAMSNRHGQPSRTRARLQVEQLESRSVPTVVAAAYPGAGAFRYETHGAWKPLVISQYSQLPTQVATDSHGDVAVGFGLGQDGGGLWRYRDKGGWKQLTPFAPSHLAMAGDGFIAADIPGSGIYRFEDRTGWKLLWQTEASQLGIDDKGDVVAVIPHTGTWLYRDKLGWKQLSPSDASSVSIAGNGDVAASFHGTGVWRWESKTGWLHLLTVLSKKDGQVAINSHGDIAFNFPKQGVWRYRDNQGWRILNANRAPATSVAIGPQGEVVATFAGKGISLFDGAWHQLNPADPSQIAVGN
jgi:hypothetical protein